MTEAIQFGSRTIDFRLEYSDRKSLAITVTPEMEVLGARQTRPWKK